MTGLVVIVPSRGRPQAATELAEAFAATCTAASRLVFAVDNDDPTRHAYAEAATRYPATVIDHGLQPATMVTALNTAALGRAHETFALGFMGDDHRPRTKGWDQRYLDELKRLGTGLVYGNDLLQGERIPTQVAITADIVRELGYMAPPGLRHMYVDNAWLALGQALGAITYLPDVIVEHLHPLAGKGAWDDGYARVNAPEVYADDRRVFGQWLWNDMPAAVDRIRERVNA